MGSILDISQQELPSWLQVHAAPKPIPRSLVGTEAMGWRLLRRSTLPYSYLHIKLPGTALPSKGEDQNAVIF